MKYINKIMLQPSSYILRNVRTYFTNKNKLLGVYSSLPYDLFRINSTEKVILRDFEEQNRRKRSAFDVVLDPDGLVQPSTGELFVRPNGMSVRPNGPYLQEIIRNFIGRRITVYKLPKDLDLKNYQLILLWEHTDHHSVQTTIPIKLDELNEKLTKLCLEKGEKLTKNEFLKKYPFNQCL